MIEGDFRFEFFADVAMPEQTKFHFEFHLAGKIGKSTQTDEAESEKSDTAGKNRRISEKFVRRLPPSPGRLPVGRDVLRTSRAAPNPAQNLR